MSATPGGEPLYDEACIGGHCGHEMSDAGCPPLAEPSEQERPAAFAAVIAWLDESFAQSAARERGSAFVANLTRKADTSRDERLQLLRNRTEGAYEEFGSGEVAWLLDEHDRLTALLSRQAIIIGRVRAVCADHWVDQVRREAKFGRTGSACVCGICEVMRVLGDPVDAAVDHAELASVIWKASKSDEGTISATGANVVASAVMAHFTVFADGGVVQNIELPPTSATVDPAWAEKARRAIPEHYRSDIPAPLAPKET